MSDTAETSISGWAAKAASKAEVVAGHGHWQTYPQTTPTTQATPVSVVAQFQEGQNQMSKLSRKKLYFEELESEHEETR